MIRAFALAIGITLCILGAECLLFEKVILAAGEPTAAPANAVAIGQQNRANQPQIIQPPEWAPWSLLSAGAVVIIYSFTIPRRVSGN